MKKFLLLICVFKQQAMEVTFDLTGNGWPYYYIDKNNKNENLQALIENRIKNKKDINLPIQLSCLSLLRLGTPLFEAIEIESLEIATLILASKGDPNAIPEGHSYGPLHKAICSNNLAMVALLINHGADVNLKTKRDAFAPLHLLATGFEFDSDKKAALAQLLLKNGANPNTVNAQGETPLFRLAYLYPESKPVLELLLKHGACTLIKNNEGHYIFSTEDMGCLSQTLAITQSFIKKIAKPIRLYRRLFQCVKPGNSPFRVLPKEIMLMIIRLACPEPRFSVPYTLNSTKLEGK